MSQQKINITSSIKQHQSLLLSATMKQALHVLQMPVGELSNWLEKQIEENPLLEMQASHSSAPPASWWESAPKVPSLYDHLMEQVQFELPEEEHALAELLIGNLDTSGLFTKEIESFSKDAKAPQWTVASLIEKMQHFDPPGIFSRSIKECIAIQLKKRNASIDLIHYIHESYDEMLNGKMEPSLRKRLEKEFASLSLQPAAAFSMVNSATVRPDLIITHVDGYWEIHLDDALPELKLSEETYELLQHEERYRKRHMNQAVWLVRMIERRRKTLKELGEHILQQQKPYLLGKSAHPKPMRMQVAAEKLSVHESTIARAVRDKYVCAPIGMIPLKRFFSHAINSSNGVELAPSAVRDRIKTLIASEVKKAPLSDEAIAKILREEGVSIARRTVAKYRMQLELLSAYRRKQLAQ